MTDTPLTDNLEKIRKGEPDGTFSEAISKALDGFVSYLFFQNPADGALRDAVACAGEDLSDPLVAAETGPSHQVDEASHRIGESSDRRVRHHQRAHRLVSDIHLAFPPGDGS